MKRLLLAIGGLVVICGCGGGGGGGGGYTPPASPPAIFVSISPAAQTNIDQGQTVKFSATVENDSASKGVTWSCSASGLTGTACGSFSNTTTTSATYNAPSSVSANLSVTVTATSVADTTKTSSAVVMVCPPPSITSTALTTATPNASYSATVQASGGAGTLTWALMGGALPSGLTMSSSGAITGTPTVFGTFTFTAQVTDASAGSGGPCSAQGQISLTVATVMRISTTSLPAGSLGTAYLAQVDASGGTTPYAWSLAAGQLPPGLSLLPSSGVISGSPTSQGSFTFTVTVRDSCPSPQTQTQSLAITINAAGPPTVTITTTTLANATPNANYSAALQATGGIAPLTWSLASGALPTGLSLASSGAITGDPTVPGTFGFTVQVTDSSAGPASAQAPLSITVVTVMSISTTSLPAGSEGITYLAQIEASGGIPPYAWSLATGSLPPGLTMQPASGVFSGSPTSQGNFTFTVAVWDSSPTPQTQTQPLTIAIGAPGPLVITTTSLLDGTVSKPYAAMAAAMGGTPPYTWSTPVGTVPPSVSLNPSTGAIAGTPSSLGTTYFTVMVTDSSSTPETQTQALSITVDNPAEACTSSGNNTVLHGPYAFSLSGFNDAGFLAVVGSFTADGTGRITAGEADTNGVLGAQHGNIITSASSYSVGPDGRGCATLATPFGTFATHFALGSMSSNPATSGRMIEWDSPSSSAYIATGQVLRQNSSAFAGGLTGSYVFRTVGWDPAPLGGRDACVGVIGASGNTFIGMEQDCNDAWNISNTAAPDAAGTYTSLDANGRGTGIIALLETNSNITFYTVSSSQLLMLNADSGPWASGEWDQQSVPAGGGGFTQASLNGNMVFYLNGLSMVGTASAVSMETASADGSSSMAITFYEDRAGAMQVSSTYTCTYAVEPSGRVTLSSDSQTCGGTTPIFYLSGLNTGFIVDTAPGVDTGSIEPQSGGPFNNASLAGNFFGGMAEVVIQSAQTEVDPVAPNGSGSIAGTTDISSTSAQDAGSSFLAATYTVNPDGTFNVNSSGGVVAGIIISSTKFVMFSPTTLATSLPTLLVMQQ
jgi:hypothetical protein